MDLEINRKTIPVGEVVYFIQPNGVPYRYRVQFGTVEEHYSTEIALQLYEPAERRLINSIPYNDFPQVTDWKKLPKGWTYSTQLYDLDHAEPDERWKKAYYIDQPKDIRKAIDDGILVPVRSIDHTHIEVEIDKSKGYRLVKKSEPYSYHQDWISLPYREVYTSYDEAKKKIDEIEAEYKRQSELSDYDWSVELIDKTINRAILCSIITEDQGAEIRERLLAMDNVEDIEVRCYNMAIQWKYWKNKKWIAIKL